MTASYIVLLEKNGQWRIGRTRDKTDKRIHLSPSGKTAQGKWHTNNSQSVTFSLTELGLLKPPL